MWIAGALEVVGGVLVTLGLFTRTAAFIISGEMAVAYFMSHAPASFIPSSTAATARYSIAWCFCISHSRARGR